MATGSQELLGANSETSLATYSSEIGLRSLGNFMPNDDDMFDGTSQQVNLADVSKLQEFKVNILFWKRAARILPMGLENPATDFVIWLLVITNVLVQVLGGYIAQVFFYYAATGHGSTDPGLAGCLNGGCGLYATYANSTNVNKTVSVLVDGVWQSKTMKMPKNSTLVLKTVPTPGDRRVVEFYLGKFAWGYFILVGCVASFSVLGDIINVLARRRIARLLQQQLLEGNTLYRLTLDGRVDNFDQRITSDLQEMLNGFMCVIFGNTSDYLAYPLGFTLCRMSFAWYNSLANLPYPNKAGLIVIVAFALFFIALLAYVVPMNQVSRIFFIGQCYEGDFRYTHTRGVVHCESVAFYHGETRERVHAERRFKKLYFNWIRYYVWQGILMILRLIVTICQPSLSYMALAISGANDKTYGNAFVKQYGDVLEYLLYLPMMVSRLAFAAGATHRLGQLLEVVHELQNAEEIKCVSSMGADYIELKNIVARPPVFKEYEQSGVSWWQRLCACLKGEDLERKKSIGDKVEKKNLFQNVSLRVDRGHPVVIMGPSGCGKSSLLRVIGGLWPIISGSVCRPDIIGSGGIYFLPQRPYVFVSNLADQITYPKKCEEYEDKNKMAELLRQVGLGHLMNKLNSDNAYDWRVLLSTSEMQRLSFARLFFHHPHFCLADEATSAMDLYMENQCLKKCSEMGITLISVAHRPTVIPHHEFVFAYSASSKAWEMRNAREIETPSLGHLQEPVELPLEPATKPQAEKEAGGFGLLFFRRLFRAFGMADKHLLSWSNVMFVIMFCMMGTYGGLQIVIFVFYPSGPILTNVVTGNTSTALNTSLTQVGINVACSALQSISAVAGTMFAMFVHRALVRNFHRNYFTWKVSYLMNRVDKQVTVVDQRIVQDVSLMREALSWLFGCPFSYLKQRNGIVFQTEALIVMMGYAFYRQWSLTLFFLIIMLLTFFFQILSTFLTARAQEERQSTEADLREHFALCRTFVESITFFTGQAVELERAEIFLSNLIARRMHYVMIAALTTFPTVAMYYGLQNGDYVMAAIIQVYWHYGVSPDMYSMIAFLIVIGKLVVEMIMAAGGIGQLVGLTHRVMDAVEKAEELRNFSESTNIPRTIGNELRMNNISITTPDKKRTLLRNFNLQVSKGRNVVIMGPSGCGKSSILRVLSGINIPSFGSFAIPRPESVFFIPQTSYATEGTLKEQVIYPLDASNCSDETVLNILDEVGLLYLSRRWGLHNVVPWEEVLSGGEQQRLGFARLFFHEPLYAVLDEATSALDVPLEERMYAQCTKRGITVLSVGTRPSLLRFHSTLIQLDGSGGYREVNLEEPASPQPSAPTSTPTNRPPDSAPGVFIA